MVFDSIPLNKLSCTPGNKTTLLKSFEIGIYTASSFSVSGPLPSYLMCKIHAAKHDTIKSDKHTN